MQHYSELERISIVSSNNNSNLVDGLYNPVLLEQTVFIHKFDFRADSFNRLLQNIRADQNRIFNSESLKELYETSGKILLSPEKALNLFNHIQSRTQWAAGQISRYTDLKQEITALLEIIKLEVKQ